MRYDIVWQQPRSHGAYVANFGNGKGLELIPVGRVEVIVGIPPYVAHHDPSVADGFGDVRMLVKYRLLSSPEDRGNYILTTFLDVSFPTGSRSNGQPNSIITPTLAYGRGLGRFDVQGTFGVSLPTRHQADLGRAYAWHNAFQYHVFEKLWPEIEVNATFFQDGKNDGRRQVFLTPGLVVGRMRLANRLALTVGAGVQLPVSDFRTSSHNIVLSARLPF